MKKYAGYINLKNLNGVLYPSSIQNIMMKDYVQNVLKGKFYLSPTEVLQAKFPITLKTLIGKETNVNGIVMLSSFYLPENYQVRKQIYKNTSKYVNIYTNTRKNMYIFEQKQGGLTAARSPNDLNWKLDSLVDVKSGGRPRGPRPS